MKPFVRVLSILALSLPSLTAATATINLSIGQLLDASGNVIADGGGTWAIIVAAGNQGAPPNAGALPGGLTLGTSLSAANLGQAAADFNGVSLTTGSKGSFYISNIGSFNSGASLGLNGMIQQSIEFNVYASPDPDPGFTAGTNWGVYWFPGMAAGALLTGTYQVGGFANAANTASGGNSGTVVPAVGSTLDGVFFESTLNQGTMGGADTGLAKPRFTAVVVPEPATLTLSALGLLALLRRRR